MHRRGPRRTYGRITPERIIPGSHPAPEGEADEAIGFATFCRAVHQLIACSCCGAGGGGAIAAAPPERHDRPFTRLGFAAWRDGLRRRPPKVRSIRGPYVLPAVAIVHADGGTDEQVDVEVQGEVISAIRPAGTAVPYPVATLEECRGAFVSSALIDLHVHMPPDNALRLTDIFLLQTLRHGITIVRDAGDTDGSATPAALDAVLSGGLPGPQIFYAYAFVNHPPGRWSNAFVYADPAQAPAIVSRLKQLGAAWVKSYENLDVERIEALKRAAAAEGLGVMGHVPYRLQHETARLPDAQHLFGVPPAASIRRDHVFNRAVDWQAVDRARMDAVRRACCDEGLALTPTLNTVDGVLDLQRHETARHEAHAKALPAFFADIVWHPRHGLPAYRNISADDFAQARDARARKHQLVRLLHEDGVELRLGTDTQQPFVAPGAALHREMRAFEEAGVPRAAVFEKATAGAARALGLADGGSPRAGARAELLVSRSDPRLSPWSVDRELQAVVARGALVFARDLDAAIGRELSRFDGVIARHAARWLVTFAMNRAARNFVS